MNKPRQNPQLSSLIGGAIAAAVTAGDAYMAGYMRQTRRSIRRDGTLDVQSYVSGWRHGIAAGRISR